MSGGSCEKLEMRPTCGAPRNPSAAKCAEMRHFFNSLQIRDHAGNKNRQSDKDAREALIWSSRKVALPCSQNDRRRLRASGAFPRRIHFPPPHWPRARWGTSYCIQDTRFARSLVARAGEPNVVDLETAVSMRQSRARGRIVGGATLLDPQTSLAGARGRPRNSRSDPSSHVLGAALHRQALWVVFVGWSRAFCIYIGLPEKLLTWLAMRDWVVKLLAASNSN